MSDIHERQNYTVALVFLALLAILFACKPKSSDQPLAGAPGEDMSKLELEDIKGTDVKGAKQLNANGGVEIEGFVRNGKKTGQWIQYDDKGDIVLINHFIDGQLNGTALRMSYRNQVDLRSTYRNGKLNGPWVSYKFGKVTEERNYVNDKLDGLVRLYDDRTFKLKQESQYKDGLQHGYFRYYDEDGNKTLEYEYKNGEKISGGMVGQE